MAGGALGSFLFATSTGKNEVHELHDIFHINEKKKNTKTPYQQRVEEGKKIDISDKTNDIDNDEVIDNSETRKMRRLSRRKTVANRIEKGRGLSDSHSGHWVDEGDTSLTQQQRTIRRRALTKRMEEGKGLSDSHSGKWE